MTDKEQELHIELEAVRGELQSTQARLAELEKVLSKNQNFDAVTRDQQIHRFHVLDNLMEGCQIIGFDWRYLYLNDAAMRHSQESRARLLGHTMMECYPGIETTGMFAVLRRCMEHRLTERLENEFVYSDGATALFELSIQPVPEGIFILSLDITERKHMNTELLQSERRYRSLIEDQSELVCRYDHNFMFTFVNRAYGDLYGKRPDEMIGTSILSLIVPEQREAVIAHVMALNATNPVGFSEHRTLMPDGSIRWFQWQDRALLDSAGYVTEYQGVGRDITKQKLAEQELAALYNATSHLFQADGLITLGQQIVETVVTEFEHADCGLILVGENDNTIVRLARTGAYNVQTENALTLDGVGLVPLAIRTNRKVYVSDVTQDADYLPSDTRTRSELVVPLTTSRGLIGVLDLQHAEIDAFSERDQRILAAYAERAAVAIENMQLYEQVNAHAADLESRVAERTAELVRAKERVEAILNNSVDAIVLADPDFNIRQTNTSFNRLFACESDDYFGRQLADLALSIDAKFINTAVQVKQIERGNHYVEFRASRKDGSSFNAEINVGFIKNEGVVCTIRDITQRKQAEIALRESEEKFRQLVKAAPIAIIMTNTSGEMTLFNDQAEVLFGYEGRESLGQPIEMLLPDAVRDAHIHHREDYITAPRTRQMGIGLELLARRKNGSEFPVEIQLGYIRMQTGLLVMSFIADITDRKNAEQALYDKLAEEREFQTYLKALHEITLELGEIDRLDDFYQRAIELGLQHLGHERLALFLYDAETETAIGTFGTDVDGQIVDERYTQFTPASEGIMRRAFQRSERFAFRASADLSTASVVTGRGWNAAAVLWNGDETLGWLMADNGVTHKPATQPLLDILALYALTLGSLLARKRVQSDLRESEARYRLLADNATDLVMRSNPAAEFVYVSPSVEVMFGYTPDELLGKSALEFVHPDDLTETQNALERTLDPDLPDVKVTLRFRHLDGHYIWLEVIGQAIIADKTGEPQGFIAAGRDVTERKAAEDTLRRTLEKEKELGELKSRFVSMASHEFRTPLATIHALTETVMAYRHKLQEDQIDDRLNKILEQVGHLKDIMDDVLQLARLQARRAEFNPVLIDMDSLCRSVMHEFEGRSEVTQTLVYTCDAALHEVYLDKKLMRQIINNLMSNAVKYSPADSTIMVALKAADSELILSIQDEGIGIPEADLKHLYTPFHRAANVGVISGTGLGLVIVKESVELHGGTIEVTSQVGIGTIFTVKIPIKPQGTSQRVETS